VATPDLRDHAAGEACGERTPPARPATERHDLALAAAIEVIAVRGADQTRYRDVADRSGIPIATLQYILDAVDATVQIFGLLDGVGAALILQTEHADPERVRRLVLDAALRIAR
jgi:hypothetical protein